MKSAATNILILLVVVLAAYATFNLYKHAGDYTPASKLTPQQLSDYYKTK